MTPADGRPSVEPVPAQPTSDMDFEKAALVRRELGLDGLEVTMTHDLVVSQFEIACLKD